jgi:protein-L-isoaspartate(D-aspartate) O-methyltransferase
MRPAVQDEEHQRALRLAMVEQQLRNRGISQPRVLAAMARVPRHRFVPGSQRARAYEDRPLAIGHQQTISQPLMVATTLSALELRGDERVLEIGTGSGYQAALLGELAASVIGIERIAELAERARAVLAELGYDNVQVLHRDGIHGCPEAAPFDAIAVAAGAQQIPQALLDQLAVGGRLVIPVGPARAQDLLLVRRTPEGLVREDLGQCMFVPLIGAQAGDDEPA